MSEVFVYYNPNPLSNQTNDCAVRALSKALDMDWETVFAILSANAFSMGGMPSSNFVWSATLRKYGYYRDVIPNTCPDCYTAEDFCYDHPYGTYVLSFDEHVATVKDGKLYDSWDSSQKVPQYFWYRKE